MKLTKKFLMALLLRSVYSHEALWRKVDLAETKLTETTYQEEIQAKQVNQCFMSCYSVAWCLLTCWNQTAESCILSNVIVSGNYIENESGATLLSCYTKKVSNLVVGKSIQADSDAYEFSRRGAKNLVDGFYNYDIEECWNSEIEYLHWATVDLGTPVYISEIVFICQPNNYASHYCKDMTVKVGVNPDPDTMDTFGGLSGPGASNQTVTLTAKTAPIARYIYIEKAYDNERVQICHLEAQGMIL